MRSMVSRSPVSARLLLLATLVALPAVGAESPAAAKRVNLVGQDGKAFPYTVEIPGDWVVRPDAKGAWLSPAGPGADQDPRAILVRASPADLRDPASTVRSIEESDKKDDTWSAPLVTVKEVGGVKGVLVQMDAGQGASARSVLVLKLPVGETSVDLMASVAPSALPALRPLFEKIFFSVQPAKK